MQQRWQSLVTFVVATALFIASSHAQDYNTIYSWGINDSGSLGLAGVSSNSTPAAINFNKNVVRAASGLHFTVLVTDDLSSQLWAFGSNSYNQLGLGDSAATPAYSQVVQVTFSSGLDWPIVEVAAGEYHVIVRTTSNIMWAWGRNDQVRRRIFVLGFCFQVRLSFLCFFQGQLGIGGTTSASVPTLVDMSFGMWQSTVAKIVAGGHSLALDTNGNLFCWGSNQYGYVNFSEILCKIVNLIPF
jgi:alpha-tubulin suppressor-like RCC1 family protein